MREPNEFAPIPRSRGGNASERAGRGRGLVLGHLHKA